MNRNELIAACFAFTVFVIAMVSPVLFANSCKTEAIKAGYTAENVHKACGR